jgi:hypothetical protein
VEKRTVKLSAVLLTMWKSALSTVWKSALEVNVTRSSSS